ncbi:2515_t:CDS:1, partial [Ambispora leptoticha]
MEYYHPTVRHWHKRVDNELKNLYGLYGRYDVKFVGEEDLKLMQDIVCAGTAKLEELGEM